MPGTTRTWLVVATVLVAATVATANVETGELGEYYMKRSQETRFRRGGPLHDIISAARRYHQHLFSSSCFSAEPIWSTHQTSAKHVYKCKH
ncbi:unnamed protein product [Triticum turgidum subsp. durum]|uniref:Uncharacterized protein n=1 Tax=Triticum turgidum subsp. durum TaxID=4567 RepID=A0A9R1AJX8_TRITD|nr:unnamed protein product [Triticum turgidum subsp. durum]